MQRAKKEIDEHYYLRRVKTPIFHVVGKLDATLGYEDIYLPWKKLVGTDAKNLKTNRKDTDKLISKLYRTGWQVDPA